MTIPSADQCNYVVAEDFSEFFDLGYYVGWFSLEEAIYEPDEASEYFGKVDPDDPDYKVIRMNLLRKELGIRPKKLSMNRISELTEKYASFLVVPNEPA